MPLKKVFILTQFGSPHPWTQEYLEHLGRLEKDGWYWKIFTPNTYVHVPSNVEIVNMDIGDFSKLASRKLGVDINNYLVDGRPSKPVSDYYVASGVIFEDYIKDFDYWGITNWDIVYGNLSKFLPDERLAQCDIWTDDINTINGIFCLFKNNDFSNNLFKKIPDWQNQLSAHQLFGSDEYGLTDVIRTYPINVGYPPHHALHSHDRLEQHVPEVKLQIKDGSLYELFKDTAPPNWIHARPLTGKEIMMFHFLKSKTWPSIQ